MTPFSVIIPSRNAANLSACVAAIRKAGETCEIVVVDDDEGSDVYSVCITEACQQVRGVKPFVFARAINQGIRHAYRHRRTIDVIDDPNPEGVILLNDDALLETPCGFTELAKQAKAHPEYGIIGAVTNVTGQPLQFRQNIGLREVEHFAFVCLYVPRKTLEVVGGMDERYCLDYGVEDRDYCMAVRHAALKCGVYDFCYVDHGALHSEYRGNPTAPRDFCQNYALFKQKWGIA